MTDTTAPVDFSAHYTVERFPGVAWRLLGYVTEWTEESWSLACDDPAHVYEYTEDYYEPEDQADTHGPECYLYNEPEEVDDTTRVQAVMVGNDRVAFIDVDDLVLLPESGFCRDCGQVGCTSNVCE